MWSSAAVAHLLQGSTCCVFRDGILHTLVVTSGFLSYCCLSIISNQSAPPFSSDLWHQQGIFIHTTAAHWISLEMVVCENPSRSAVYEILRPAHLAPTTIPRSKSLKSPLLPRNKFRWLNVLSCCHVIDWLAICVTKQSNRCMAGECIYIYIYIYYDIIFLLLL